MNFQKILNRFYGSYYFFNLLVPEFKPPKAYLNWLLANYEMKRQVSKVSAKPLKLTFEPSNICQLHCPLCPTGLRVLDRSPEHANIEMFSRLLDEVGEYVFFIDFYNWGEPLLNPHIEDFLFLSNKKKISTTLSTNLSLKVSDDRFCRLIKSGLNHIIISLDGATAESYTKYRRGGNFDLVIDNMRRLVEIRKREGSRTPYITWQFLIYRFNEHELDKAQEMAREIGVDRIWFTKAYLDEGEYPMSDDDRATIRKWIPSNPSFTFYNPQDIESNPSVPLKQKGGLRRGRCDWHYITSAVNSDGSVAPCCAVYKQSDIFGSLGPRGETSYMETINNHNFTAIRNGFAGRFEFPEELACSQCLNGMLMGYAKGVNRWIVITTIAKLIHYTMLPLKYLFGIRNIIIRPKLKIKWPD